MASLSKLTSPPQKKRAVADLHVTGLAALDKYLQELPVKIEKNVLRGSLRAGMKVVQPMAAANIHSVSGLLAAGLKIRTNAKGGRVTARLVATGKHAYVAKWVEFGTQAHVINGKLGGSLFFGGVFAKQVMHPGAKPHKFLRPALDAQAQSAIIAAAEYMKKRLATKEGLDTADIVVEGEL